MQAGIISLNLMLVNFFFHNSSLWSQQVQFPVNVWDSDSQTFSEDRNPRCFWGWGICEKFILSIKRLVSKHILGRRESLLCLAGPWQPGTATQAADSTQIPTVRRFHLDLAETSLVFSWSSYCPPAVSGTSCSRFPSFPAVKVAQLSQSCGLLTAEHSSAKWLSGYLH